MWVWKGGRSGGGKGRGGEGVVEVGVVPLGSFFYVCGETSTQQSISHPQNKSGRIFPLRQGIDGGGGFIEGGTGSRTAYEVLTVFRDLYIY